MRTHDQSTRPDPTALPRSTPAGQGVDAAGIDRFLDAVAAADDIELHSLLVVRHGHVVAEAWWHPYQPDTPRLLYSLSKSFTATALGFAVDEGLVELDATVLSYFPEFDRLVTDERSRSIRVRHVAAMASGHDDETIGRAAVAGDGDLLLGLLLIAPDREPGTVFAYNQPCTYALSAILQKVSGASLTEFLRPRLFAPLGISAYGWQADAVGRDLGYSGFHATTEAVAKLGQLYLRNGEWAGRQLLSAEWVAEATRAHIATNPDPNSNSDWDRGYGFQFWRSRHGYRGDGAFGQCMLVLPEADAVVAITSQTGDLQGLLNAVWTHLLPAFGSDTATGPIWTAGSPALARPGAGGPVGELPTGSYRPGPGNELATLHTVQLQAGTLVLTDAGPPVTARLGDPAAWTGTGPLATAYGWADGQLQIDVVFVETPHRLCLSLDPGTCRFTARWQLAPLDEQPLAAMRMPR